MLTIFALPKAFRGHFDVIQRNAIRSWMKLSPQCQIILVGDDEGTAEVASEFGLHHVPAIERNEYGTPLLPSVFDAAEQAAVYPWLCYINADIILLDDFLPVVQGVLAEMPKSLLVGGRWDLDVKKPLAFNNGWQAELRARVKRSGRLRPHGAIDYFVFPPGLFGEIPPFAIGRTTWDQWLIYRAVSQKVPVVDITKTVQAVHQNHPYVNAQTLEEIEKTTEGRRNFGLAGGYSHAYNLWDTQFKLTKRGIRRRRSPYFFYRQLTKLGERNPFASGLFKLVRAVLDATRT